MRTVIFLATVAIAALFIEVSDARTLRKKRANVLDGLVGGATGPTGPLGSVAGITNGLATASSAGQAHEEKKKRDLLGGLLGGGGGGLLDGLLGGGSKSKPSNHDGSGGRGGRGGRGRGRRGGSRGGTSRGQSKGGLPIVGGLLGKRNTGFPETAETRGKTILVFDADKITENPIESSARVN